MTRHTLHPATPTPTRSGSTLTEVLISVMVIGIGAVSVATLFPLSVMRAVRANQLTQGTILRYNAEEQMETQGLNSYWMFVVEPFGFGNVGNTPWTSPHHYPGAVGDDNGNLFRDNIGWHPGPDGYFGVPGAAPGTPQAEPGYSDNSYVSDDIPILDEFEVRFAGRDSSLIVIDPLGWWLVGDIDPANLNLRNTFGANWPAGYTVIPRLNGGFRGNNSYSASNPRVRPTFIGDYFDSGSGTFVRFDIPAATTSGNANDGNLDFGGWGFNRQVAERIATLPDQYSTLLDTLYADVADIATITTRDELLLPNKLPVNVLADPIGIILAGLEVRATFFGIQGTATTNKRVTYTRSLLHEDANGNGALDPGEDIDNDGVLDVMTTTSRLMKLRSDQPLPANFQIERITLQTQLSDFTWMATARLPSRPPTQPQIDVVVFHKRRFETIDERPYVATQVAGSKKVYTIDYSATAPVKPWAKKGGFMFDMEHGYWFLITNMSESGTTITVTLERDVRDVPFGPADDLTEIIACFPRGIVDVFPLGAK